MGQSGAHQWLHLKGVAHQPGASTSPPSQPILLNQRDLPAMLVQLWATCTPEVRQLTLHPSKICATPPCICKCKHPSDRTLEIFLSRLEKSGARSALDTCLFSQCPSRSSDSKLFTGLLLGDFCSPRSEPMRLQIRGHVVLDHFCNVIV